MWLAPAQAEPRRRFARIATAGIFFQGGAAAVDPGTIVATLVHGLTGSAFAVGGAAAIARYGWLFPQLFVAYFAQRRRRRLPFYKLGAFGRVIALAVLAAVLMTSEPLPGPWVVALFFVLWAAYAFIGGILAVPYNDIVARAILSEARSRLLAVRFFGGGILALLVAAAARPLLGALPFPDGHAAILLLGTGLLLTSAFSFVSAGEPLAPPPAEADAGFARFVRAGLEVFRSDRRLRLFVHARWLHAGVTMALPFYVLQATAASVAAADVPVLLGAQTAGALLSNPLWGWWGDVRGKQSLLEGVIALACLPPLATLAWLGLGEVLSGPALPWFGAIFFLLGAVNNGETIAQLGYLMEISPDDRRPAYSGYFNALTAPAALSPVLGGAFLGAAGAAVLFAASAAAALLELRTLGRLRRLETAPEVSP